VRDDVAQNEPGATFKEALDRGARGGYPQLFKLAEGYGYDGETEAIARVKTF
jgi:hypothetical protein